MKSLTKLFSVLFLLLPFNLAAQYAIRGTVSDKNTQESLVGAHVSIENTNLKTITNQNGEFYFDKIKKGEYVIIASFIGFETEKQSTTINSDKTVNFSLQPTSFMQDEIVVRSTRNDDKTPLTYSEIDAAELRKINKGADLPYLLQNTPSLVVTSDAGAGVGYTNLRIRGSDITRINVTMNGVPVNDPETHTVYFVDLPDIASSIDNIQIQRGVGTSTNGAAAFGASINIKTDEVETEPYAMLNSNVGSFNTLKNTLSFSTGRSKNGFNINGRLSKITSDGYIDRGWSDLGSYYLSGSWSGKKTLVKLIATSGVEKTYQAWNGIPKDSIDTNPTYNPSGEMFDQDGNIKGYYDNETDNYQQDYYQLHVAHSFRNNLILSATAFLTNGKGYYETWKNQKSFSSYGLPDVVIGNEVISKTDLIQQKWLENSYYGLYAALEHKTGRFSTTYGGGWNQFDGNHFGKISWAQFASTSTNDWDWYRGTGLKTDYHVFAKTNIEISRKISLFIDLQYRHIDYDMKGTHDDLRNITQSHTFDFFNPKSGIFFTINSQNSMYFSVAKSNREPSRTVYRDADLNQKINPEQLLDFELGYSLNNKKLNFNTNIYYMNYKEQLVMTGKINNIGSAIMTNVPESYRLGIENSLNYKLLKKLNIGLNLSLSTNKIKNFTEFVDNWNYWDDTENQSYQYEFELGTTDISFSPSVVGGASITYLPIKNMEINLIGNYVSRQYLDNTSNKYRSLDPYFISNLNINYEWKQPIFKTLTLSLSVNNLFNEKYETYGWVYKYINDGAEYLEDGYFPQAGTNFMFGITIGI